MVVLGEVDRRQLAAVGGCGSLGEWVRGRLDVAPETARDLVVTSRHLLALPDVEEAVETGQIGFDRAVAVGTLAGRGGTGDILADMAGCDSAGIRHGAAKRRRMTRGDEEVAFGERYLVVEPNLDESAWRLNGRLAGFAGRIVTDALDAKADTFPTSNPTRCHGPHTGRTLCGRSASTVSPVVTAPRLRTPPVPLWRNPFPC
jgi:hypothetical protein